MRRVDPSYLASSLISGCGAFLGAVALLAVGLTAVRKVHAGSGYLVAAAGGVLFLSSCCTSIPSIAMQAGVGGEIFYEAGDLFSVLNLLMMIGIYALVIAAMATLAKAVLAGAGGAK
jgi:hypothetical protein